MADRTVIFGATGGIGSAIARSLHEQGTPLHLVARNSSRLADLASELGADVSLGDVTKPDLFERVAADLAGPCGGLVYAVGTINLGSLQRLTAQDFQDDFDVNAMGAALAVKALLPGLKKSAGTPSVVLFSSVAVGQGFAFHVSMGMAKGAVEGLTRSLAAELAPKIRVNAIAPSLTQTPLAEGILANEKMAEAITKSHALKRLGTAQDAAALAAFLLSDQAGWITGQVLGVDGGRSSLRTSG
jgi:NAD(P)-dependent dehydrogenase (short-subunit alcohol dehydrogenase family)